ncbi:MAG: DUF6687 family protein [Planctomycetota bacterium]
MLPIRYAARPSEAYPAPGGAPALVLDGAFPQDRDPALGLHLAHWPGNRTPAALRRDLSTMTVLAFLELPEEEQRTLLNGAEVIEINHVDTDGLCALFALRHPDEAMTHRERLVEVAAAGDFHEVRSEHALAVDAALRALSGDDKLAVIEEGLRLIGELLPSEEKARQRASADLDRYAADRAALESALFDDLIYLDLAVWTSPLAGGDDAAAFDPGRHAFFADGRADRALLLGRRPDGTTARFVLGTYSFFDVVSRRPSPRPDFAALAARLNGLEGTSDADEVGWRHQPMQTASPELWFGREGLPLYDEHASPFLEPSQLSAEAIKAACIDAVRDTWPLPDDDDEADDDEDIFDV